MNKEEAKNVIEKDLAKALKEIKAVETHKKEEKSKSATKTATTKAVKKSK